MFPNKLLDFPAGWYKHRAHDRSVIRWKQNGNDTFKVVIKNYDHTLTSICQEDEYGIPVYEKQVWAIGALLGVHQAMYTTVRVHFKSRVSPRILSVSLNFMVEPGEDYYYGSITVPDGADYAVVELGTSSPGTLSIKNILFKRVFPTKRYNADSQGRLNINNVESVSRILEPVELVRPSRDFVEDVKVTATQKYSSTQDVLHLTTYSYSAINLGCSNIIYGMQLSPNGADWIEDPVADDHIAPGQMVILCYNRFARYVRLRLRTENCSSKLRIYFQGQG
jgi:hypothetical protein